MVGTQALGPGNNTNGLNHSHSAFQSNKATKQKPISNMRFIAIASVAVAAFSAFVQASPAPIPEPNCLAIPEWVTSSNLYLACCCT